MRTMEQGTAQGSAESGECTGSFGCNHADRRTGTSNGRYELRSNQTRTHWSGSTGQKHHRRPYQKERSVKIQSSEGSRRRGDCGDPGEGTTKLQLASCLRASIDEASFACDSAKRRAMRRSADRFCKLTFWPVIEIEGEIHFGPSTASKHMVYIKY